jgi:Tol biopolymer transport system component
VRSHGLILVTLLLAGLGTARWLGARAEPDSGTPRFAYVTTAHQLGVVGYRDPVGALSLDGERFAYTEGRRLFEQFTTGGVRTELAAAVGQIRHIAPFGATREWIFEDGATSPRWWAVSSGEQKRPLFGARTEVATASGSPTPTLRVDALRQVVASADGKWIAALTTRPAGIELWRLASDGSRAGIVHGPAPMASPAWTPSGEVACILTSEGHARLSVPCGQPGLTFSPAVDVIGPLAFSPATPAVYFASPNPGGAVDLWSADPTSRRAARLTSFSRDSYAPSIAGDGRVLFKVQSYRTSVAELDLTSGAMQQLSTLQAETPSYHPDGRRIAVTYGTWRRLIDDAKYPDIAQEIGVIPSMPIDTPASQPIEVIANGDSEDQAMAWSPNGKWIVLHSHREQSDDIWLRPADGRSPDRRVSFLGRGAEVGWPRWSPDGKRVLFDGASPSSGRSVLFVLGIDQESGTAEQPREIALSNFEGEVTHGEWLPDNATIVAIAKEGPGRHAIVAAPAAGGTLRVLHRFASEHDFPGLGVTPDGTRIAFVAPAPDGFFQVFALPTAGGTPQQLTFDPTQKTQPTFSPDGRHLAFTVWSYDAQFWITPP